MLEVEVVRMRTLFIGSVALGGVLAVVGCSRETAAPPAPPPVAATPVVAAPNGAPVTVTIEPSAVGAGRDPFQPGELTAAPPPPKDTVARKARKYALDELRLVAVVTGGDTRAMLLDPHGKGWVVTRGDHVGRSEAVGEGRTGWRVERIRDAEVVFAREDPTRRDRPPETRTLALHAGAPTEPLEMDD
jgi:hypothetical protein